MPFLFSNGERGDCYFEPEFPNSIIVKGMKPCFSHDAKRRRRMQESSRKQARAIAIAKARDDQFRRLGFMALGLTMIAACGYCLSALVF
jgi:hypothetical protein